MNSFSTDYAITPLEILQRARAQVAVGWMQGEWSNAMGCYCAGGAIISATDVLRASGEVKEQATILLAKAIDPNCYPTTGDNAMDLVVGWNDKTGRTQDEVLKAFQTAIEAINAPA